MSSTALETPRGRLPLGVAFLSAAVASALFAAGLPSARADSVNSPNINLNVDTNRSTGNGAGNVAVTINTITIAEISVDEYASGGGEQITLSVRAGFQFDPTSIVTVQSATIGFNGGGINAVTSVTPTGAADEVLTFILTSGTSGGQDILRVNGIKLKILSAAGAAGPAQTTLTLTTSTAGGAFTDQGIVAANILKGAADHLVFSIQPGNTQAGEDLLPAVKVVDFGGNIVTNDPRTITLTIQDNPGVAALNGTTQLTTINGVAAWADAEDLNLTVAAAGYTLRAAHDGAAFLTGDTVDSGPFEISAGPPGELEITLQPVDTAAGGDILVEVTAEDQFGNPITAAAVDVTLDSAVNPGGWPLLVDTSLTKATVNGVASWAAADNLRINKAITGYQLSVSGNGEPVLTDEFDITPAAPDHLVISEQPVDTVAGGDLAISVESRDAFENRTTNADVDVTLSLSVNPGNATLDATSSLTKTTVDGVAAWDADDDLSIRTAAIGYRIAASGAGAGAESDAFEIFAGSPDHLEFTQQPADVTAGENILLAVVTRDAFDNLSPATGIPITLELTTNPGDADLLTSGNLTKETTDGAVAWEAVDELRIEIAANDYVISASGLGDPVSADAFDVAASAPAGLRFVTQPTNVLEDAVVDPPVTVEAIDEFGNRAAAVVPVTLSLSSSCGGALSGAEADSVAGLATFDALAVDTACDGIILTADSPELDSATSEAFSVTALPPPPNACGVCAPGAAGASVQILLTLLLVRRCRRRRGVGRRV